MQSAPKPCTHVGCSVLVRDGSSRCPDHKRPAWLPARAAVKRTTGRRLQAQRAALFAREPLCRVCVARGFTVLATQRDHIVSLAEGGTDDDSNVQPLCDDCHREKTLAEALRARGGQPLAGGGLASSPRRLPAPDWSACRPAAPGGDQMSGAPQAETGPEANFLRAQVSGEGGVAYQTTTPVTGVAV